MAEVINIKRGLDIKLQGKAKDIFTKADLPDLFAVCPDDFYGITPKVVVKDGEAVKVGSVLFHDKKNPDIIVVSPASGTILAVNRGEKRKVLTILIQSDGQFESVELTKTNLSEYNANQVKKFLLNAGFWPFIKQRPYDIVANPEDTPRAIFISGFDSAPLAPDYDFILVGKNEDFQMGIDILSKLVSEKIHVGINAERASKVFKSTKNIEIHEFKGPHPAGNVGVQIHHISPINKGEIVWTINLQDVLAIGRSFRKASIDFSRCVALTGCAVKKPAYYRLVYGASISHIVKDNIIQDKKVRYISGNPLTGKRIDPDGYLGAYDSQVTVIPEGGSFEFLGWIMPRLNKFSIHKSYFSWLTKNKEYCLDTNLNGGKRAFIMSGEYDKVFPMDILPEFLVKAILARDIDKMEQLGIYEVSPEDFSLCEFVCTSKIETQQIVREGLDYLRKELA
jgi:Na+-transporting NADH:ubiquinone oxidoreductase subunit A